MAVGGSVTGDRSSTDTNAWPEAFIILPPLERHRWSEHLARGVAGPTLILEDQATWNGQIPSRELEVDLDQMLSVAAGAMRSESRMSRSALCLVETTSWALA